ncbi:MAG TPA: glycosyl transferase [Verrucomicrobia bacterium]|nr:MAG: hypothetical protein A2X46_16600 [Lentisphaerae bacterium GWF2_57_35]HBA86071.1 glycosyl transferase [Verrucomicrobiota bacterium]
MKILHIADNDVRGGAAKCVASLHRMLKQNGHESTLLLGKSSGLFPDEQAIRLPAFWRLPYHAVNLLGLNYAGIPGRKAVSEHPCFRQAEVVHYQNIHGGYFNYLWLPRLTAAKPSVWTLHDMWGLTGHCAHSFDCERWRTGCGRCPYPKTYPPIRRDATAWEWRLKQRVYRQSRMIVACPSRWLADKAKESILGGLPVRHVPNGIDTELYRPQDRTLLRQELGWPQDKVILLFAADTLANPYKNFSALMTALHVMAPEIRSKLLLVMMGENDLKDDHIEGMRLIRLGYCSDDAEKARYYAAADIFVYPTKADNQPLVLLEALACGCPVVSMNVGGVSEVVIDGTTGYLAAAGDAEGLRRGMEKTIADRPARLQMAENGRRLVLKEHTETLHMQRMLDIYAEAKGIL